MWKGKWYSPPDPNPIPCPLFLIMVNGTTISSVTQARNNCHSWLLSVIPIPPLCKFYCCPTSKLPQVSIFFLHIHCSCLLTLSLWLQETPPLAWHAHDLCSLSSPSLTTPRLGPLAPSYPSSWPIRALYLCLFICCLCCMGYLSLPFLLGCIFSFWKASPPVRNSLDLPKQEKSTSSMFQNTLNLCCRVYHTIIKFIYQSLSLHWNHLEGRIMSYLFPYSSVLHSSLI